MNRKMAHTFDPGHEVKSIRDVLRYVHIENAVILEEISHELIQAPTILSI